jgi:hypothetical protein
LTDDKIYRFSPKNLYDFHYQVLIIYFTAYLEALSGEGVEGVVGSPGGEEAGHLKLEVVAQQQQRSHATDFRFRLILRLNNTKFPSTRFILYPGSETPAGRKQKNFLLRRSYYTIDEVSYSSCCSSFSLYKSRLYLYSIHKKICHCSKFTIS